MAFVQLLNREHHIPVLSPYDIAVLDGVLLEVLGFDVAVVLGMRVQGWNSLKSSAMLCENDVDLLTCLGFWTIFCRKIE